MLRLLVVLLILANAGFYVWQQGMLPAWLDSSVTNDREPQRLAQQVHPERLVLATNAASSVPIPQAASTASLPDLAVSTKTTQCLEAGPYGVEEAGKVQSILSNHLPSGSWTTERFPLPGLWLVYMGPYPDTEAMQRKNNELQRIAGVSFEEVRSPPELRMGFSLGRFNNQGDAQATLRSLQSKGIRTARVVSVRPAMDVSLIRIPKADNRIQQLLPSLPLPAEREFVKCFSP